MGAPLLDRKGIMSTSDNFTRTSPRTAETLTPNHFTSAWKLATLPLKTVFWLVIAVGAWMVAAPFILYRAVDSMLSKNELVSPNGSQLGILGIGANRGSARQSIDALNWLIEHWGGALRVVLLVFVFLGLLAFIGTIVTARNLVMGQRYSRVTYTIFCFITLVGFVLGAVQSAWSITAFVALVLVWLPPANRAFELTPQARMARKQQRADKRRNSRDAKGPSVEDSATGHTTRDSALAIGEAVSTRAKIVAQQAVPTAQEKLNDATETAKALGQVAKNRVQSNETAHVVTGLAARLAKRAKSAADERLSDAKRSVRGHEATGRATLAPGQVSTSTNGQAAPLGVELSAVKDAPPVKSEQDASNTPRESDA